MTQSTTTWKPGDKVLIRKTTGPGYDPKIFRAYDATSKKPLNQTASTTGNSEYAIKKCAAKVFGLPLDLQVTGGAYCDRIQIRAIGNNEYEATLIDPANPQSAIANPQ